MDRANTTTAWKTDFRNIANLPDIKVVRTSFYINIIAVGFLAISLSYAIYGEMAISEKSAEVSQIESEIVKLKPANDEAVKADSKYNSLKSTINNIDTFLKTQSIDAIQFITALGEAMPPEVMLENVDQKYLSAKITGHVKGSAEIATGIVYKFEQNLNTNQIIKKSYGQIAIGTIVKDSQNEKLNFEINFTRTPDAKKAK